VITNLSAKEFIQVFRRFTSHHSLLKLVMTDNATNLTAENKIVQRLLNNKEVQAYFSNLQIEWRFIPAGAPWYGGFWERMVALVNF
jgi:hypothetical protein